MNFYTSAHFILWTDRVRKEGHPTVMWCHLVLTVVTNSCVGSRWAWPQACNKKDSTAAAPICWPAFQRPQPLNCAGGEPVISHSLFSFLSEAPPPLSLRASGRCLGDLSRPCEEGASICRQHSLCKSQRSPDQCQFPQWSRGSKACETECLWQYLCTTS